DVAPGVDAAGVAGVEPAVAPRLHRRLGHAEIALEKKPRPPGAHHHLAGLAGRQLLVGLRIDDAQLEQAGVDPAAGAERPRLLHIGPGDDADLGHAPAFEPAHAEAALEIA